MVQKAIAEHGSMSRKEIDELLWMKLPDWMDEVQKKNKVKNLVYELRTLGKIKNMGTYRDPSWIISKKTI
ncbi:hypothetical protein GCM10023091_41120 [Ravibacter arvi]|uniref:DNA-binding protein n=1 Tax=Ravibacter arvi TaxID=2051041 RepID=A0ABP8MAF5_9BACT